MPPLIPESERIIDANRLSPLKVESTFLVAFHLPLIWYEFTSALSQGNCGPNAMLEI